jgi:hypothetical protein
MNRCLIPKVAELAQSKCMSEYDCRDEAGWLARLLYYMARFKRVYFPSKQIILVYL